MSDQYSDSALMSTNGLLYKMPQPLSVCVNRTFKKEYSQRQSYKAGETIAFDVNSGSSYVDPASCMLIFKVEFTCADDGGDAANRVSFGSGTVILFQKFGYFPKMVAKLIEPSLLMLLLKS